MSPKIPPVLSSNSRLRSLPDLTSFSDKPQHELNLSVPDSFEKGMHAARSASRNNAATRQFTLHDAFKGAARGIAGGVAADVGVNTLGGGRVDLRLHSMAGAVAGTLCGEYVLHKTGSRLKAGLASVGCATLLGLGKELLDPAIGGQQDWKDAAATAAGGASVALTYTLKW